MLINEENTSINVLLSVLYYDVLLLYILYIG